MKGEDDAFAGLIVGTGIEWEKGSGWEVRDGWSTLQKKARLNRHAVVAGCLCVLILPMYLMVDVSTTPPPMLWFAACPFAVFTLSMVAVHLKQVDVILAVQALLFLLSGWVLMTQVHQSIPGPATVLFAYGLRLMRCSLLQVELSRNARLKRLMSGFIATLFVIDIAVFIYSIR